MLPNRENQKTVLGFGKMDWNDIFRGFFGFPHRNVGDRHNIRDVDIEDEDSEESFYEGAHEGFPSHFGPSDWFEVLSNPLELQRYFESQLDDMLKTFQTIVPQLEGLESSAPQQGTEDRDLRQRMLKPGADRFGGYEQKEEHATRGDRDLDEQIATRGLNELFPRREDPLSYNFHNTWTFSSNGGVAQNRQVSTDSAGCRKEVTTHQFGDKKYVVEKRKCPGEPEEVREQFVNLTKEELDGFLKNKEQQPRIELKPSPSEDNDLYNRYFRS